MAVGRNVIHATILLALLFSASVPIQTAAQESADEKWTFLVYMSGDSSLFENIPKDIDEMKLVGSSDDLDIIVLADSQGVGDTSLARITEGGSEGIALSDVDPSWGSELDLGDAETLSKFVTWAAEAYPSDRIMLDLWGHGNGWPGICPDKQNYLQMEELRTAMENVTAAGIHLDIVSMDACQMGMLEVAYEIREHADYALISQKDVPLDGWPYDVFLRTLAGNGTVADRGGAMIEAYIGWGRAHSMYSLTLSLIDLSGMAPLANALDGYSVEAANAAGYFNPQFAAARGFTEKYDGNAQYDLAHLLQNMNSQTECKSLETLACNAIKIINASVVREAHWTNSMDIERADFAHGLSVWFPTYAPSVDYMATSFARDTAWPKFLETMSEYFQTPGRIEVQNEADAATQDSDDDGLTDALEISYAVAPYCSLSIEVYSPNGTLFAREIRTANGSLEIALGSAGYYQAALYLRDADGLLLNYTLFRDLAKESLCTISGRVVSDTGRGLRWVNLNLLDDTGRVIESVATDMNGRYRMEIIVPTDASGTGMVLECGLGTGMVNATIETLEEDNSLDFTMDTSAEYVSWLVRAAGILNLAGIMALVYWVAWGREKKLLTEEQERKT